MAANLIELQKLNDKRWHAAKITRGPVFDKIAKKIYANKNRYLDIVRRCRELGSNMPDSAWVFIGVVHNRESSLDFTTHLGQGDPLNKKTVNIPAGRGPFLGPDAFERGAVDALVYCAPKAAVANKDWSISGMLTYLERYNGMGYANRGIPSPYLWAGTNQYKQGKYISDGVFSATTVDQQLGCAGLILAIDALDDGIDFEAPDLERVSFPTTGLSPDEDKHDTVWLQWALNALGAVPQLQVDGIYGGGTRIAVRHYQEGHKLQIDGLAGKQTINSIKADLKKVGKAPAKAEPPPAPKPKTILQRWGWVS
jgi:lysozyme family protein